MTKQIPLPPDKEQIIARLFKEHFEALYLLSLKFVHDSAAAKDLVHDVFETFWQKFDLLPLDTNYKSYLFTAVRNKSFNYLRDHKKFTSLEASAHTAAPEQADNSARELTAAINQAIATLPERCREVFLLSRYEEKKYHEIAEQMGISVKTVENQMSKALRLLRDHLKDFLLWWLIPIGVWTCLCVL